MGTKFTYEYVSNYFEKNGCILLSKEYARKDDKLDYICECGNKSSISFNNFKNGHRCKECGKQKTATKLSVINKKEITNEDIIKSRNEIEYDMSFVNYNTSGEFRRIEINKVDTFKKEYEKQINNKSNGVKTCKTCERDFPDNDYFYQRNKKSSKICKECNGYKFSFGLYTKEKLRNSNLKYCQKCDTVKPMNLLYYDKNKSSIDGYSSYCSECTTGNKDKILIIQHIKCKDDHQICRKCLYELPLTEIFFFRSSISTNKYEPICKKCQGIEYGVKYLNKVYKTDNGEKYCTHCRELLPICDFYKRKTGDGYKNICKDCDSVKRAKRRTHEDCCDYTIYDWDATLKEFGERCAYCGCSNESLQKEHILPYSRGGD